MRTRLSLSDSFGRDGGGPRGGRGLGRSRFISSFGRVFWGFRSDLCPALLGGPCRSDTVPATLEGCAGRVVWCCSVPGSANRRHNPSSRNKRAPEERFQVSPCEG